MTAFYTKETIYEIPSPKLDSRYIGNPEGVMEQYVTELRLCLESLDHEYEKLRKLNLQQNALKRTQSIKALIDNTAEKLQKINKSESGEWRDANTKISKILDKFIEECAGLGGEISIEKLINAMHKHACRILIFFTDDKDEYLSRARLLLNDMKAILSEKKKQLEEHESNLNMLQDLETGVHDIEMLLNEIKLTDKDSWQELRKRTDITLMDVLAHFRRLAESVKS